MIKKLLLLLLLITVHLHGSDTDDAALLEELAQKIQELENKNKQSQQEIQEREIQKQKLADEEQGLQNRINELTKKLRISQLKPFTEFTD